MDPLIETAGDLLLLAWRALGVIPALAECGRRAVCGVGRVLVLETRIVGRCVAAYFIQSTAYFVRDLTCIVRFFLRTPKRRR